jgi:FixJ family two-component response regulator
MQEYRANIFVVEDDANLNLAVRRLLEAAGFRARSFASAEAALADASIGDADCFVLDIHLPGVSGLELHRRLMCSGVVAPVILITAHDDTIHPLTAREIGAAAYLIKPFSSVSLIEAVVHAVNR